MTQGLLNREMLDAIRELQTPDDPTFVKTFLETFIKAIPPKVEGIRQAIQSKDSQKLADNAHAIKSSCTNLGVESIIETCAHLEERGRNQTWTGVEELFQKTEKLCQDLEKEIHLLPEFK